MAIYFNGDMIEAKENGTQLEQIYWKGLQEIDALFEKSNPLVLERKVKRSYDRTGKERRPIPPIALPTEMPVYLKGIGSVSVRYSEYPPVRKDDRSIEWPLNKVFVEESIPIDEDHKDLAWFIINVSGLVKQPNKKVSRVAFLKIFNPKEEILIKASEIKRTAKIDKYLSMEDSPLYNEQALAKIADRYGIDIKDQSLDEAAYNIRQSILNGEKSKNQDINVDSFLALAKTLEKQYGKLTDNIPEVYTQGYLNNLELSELHKISDQFGTRKVPQCKKTEQIEEILKAQEHLETA